jgi:hypothetical protein
MPTTADRLSGFRVALSELLFVVLPLLVLAFVMGFNNRRVMDILDDPEWSFAAAVLMGQAVVKYVSRIINRRDAQSDIASLVVSALIVLAVVPSLIVLSLVLMTEQPLHDKGHVGLLITQISLFAMSVLLFLLLGTFGGRGARVQSVSTAPAAASNDV